PVRRAAAAGRGLPRVLGDRRDDCRAAPGVAGVTHGRARGDRRGVRVECPASGEANIAGPPYSGRRFPCATGDTVSPVGRLLDRFGRRVEERISWPDGSRAALSLSFDDARPSQVSRGLDILERLEVRVTFFVLPGAVRRD